MNGAIKTENTLQLLNVAWQHSEAVIKRLFQTTEQLNIAIAQYDATAPYHINLIEELHVDENAHSRILTKLLQFKDNNGKFEILQSFFDFINESHLIESFDVKIKKPVITQEKERIDIWIRDTDYAIILENKIYGAIDQDSQIANYIIKTKKGDDYKPEQIYVIYMPSHPYEPDERTWGHSKDVKSEFATRFGIVSFSEDILSWLKKKVLPNIRFRDSSLYCAVEQYIDYLERLYGLNKHQNQRNMELKDIITKQLELENVSSVKDRIEKLETACRDIDDLRNQINEMIFAEKRAFYANKWNEDFTLPASGRFSMDTDASGGRLGFGVTFQCDGKPTDLHIGYDRYEGKLYCQIEFSNKLPPSDRNIANASWLPVVKGILLKPDTDKYCMWEYFKSYEFEAVYQRFTEVVEKLDKMATN